MTERITLTQEALVGPQSALQILHVSAGRVAERSKAEPPPPAASSRLQ